MCGPEPAACVSLFCLLHVVSSRLLQARTGKLSHRWSRCPCERNVPTPALRRLPLQIFDPKIGAIFWSKKWPAKFDVALCCFKVLTPLFGPENGPIFGAAPGESGGETSPHLCALCEGVDRGVGACRPTIGDLHGKPGTCTQPKGFSSARKSHAGFVSVLSVS